MAEETGRAKAAMWKRLIISLQKELGAEERSRELSLAITKLDEARLWLKDWADSQQS